MTALEKSTTRSEQPAHPSNLLTKAHQLTTQTPAKKPTVSSKAKTNTEGTKLNKAGTINPSASNS